MQCITFCSSFQTHTYVMIWCATDPYCSPSQSENCWSPSCIRKYIISQCVTQCHAIHWCQLSYFPLRPQSWNSKNFQLEVGGTRLGRKACAQPWPCGNEGQLQCHCWFCRSASASCCAASLDVHHLLLFVCRVLPIFSLPPQNRIAQHKWLRFGIIKALQGTSQCPNGSASCMEVLTFSILEFLDSSLHNDRRQTCAVFSSRYSWLDLYHCILRFQHLDVMHHMAPGILQVLMPHWPQVALRLQSMHSQHGCGQTDESEPSMQDAADRIRIVQHAPS